MMKSFLSGVMLTFIISISGCSKPGPEDMPDLNVENYIAQLKAGTYDSNELPEFTSKHIPELLQYSNETQLIQDFPVNMISSFALPECSLGMYVLWTIESIRAVAIESEFLIGRFPSQNPVVEQREEPFAIQQAKDVQEIVAKAYQDWWETNKHLEFELFKDSDPLANTAYRWH